MDHYLRWGVKWTYYIVVVDVHVVMFIMPFLHNGLRAVMLTDWNADLELSWNADWLHWQHCQVMVSCNANHAKLYLFISFMEYLNTSLYNCRSMYFNTSWLQTRNCESNTYLTIAELSHVWYHGTWPLTRVFTSQLHWLKLADPTVAPRHRSVTDSDWHSGRMLLVSAVGIQPAWHSGCTTSLNHVLPSSEYNENSLVVSFLHYFANLPCYTLRIYCFIVIVVIIIMKFLVCLLQ